MSEILLSDIIKSLTIFIIYNRSGINGKETSFNGCRYYYDD